MKANELRIGNYFKSKSDKAIYELTYELLAEQFNGKDLGFDDMQPILITEEWLVKFKFRRINKYDHELVKGDVEFYTSSDFFNGNGFICLNDFDLKILYVHQIQNLYFALTGEELTIKTKQL